MFNLFRQLVRDEIDDWCDDYSLDAAALLNQAAADAIVALEPEIDKMGWRDGFIDQSSFISKHVAPVVRAVTQRVVADVLENANHSLQQLVDHKAIWHDRPGVPHHDANSLEGWQDIGVAAGPLAGGAAVAIALPGLAATTTTAWFGLATLTTISWPVVAIGGTIAGIAVATGTINTARILDKAKARMRRRVRDYVVAVLIEGTAEHPSILAQLRMTLRDAADLAKERR